MGRLVLFLISLVLAIITLPIRVIRGKQAFYIRDSHGNMTQISTDFLRTFFYTFS